MNIRHTAGTIPFRIIYTVIALVILAVVLFKPALRIFYPVKYINIIEEYSDKYNLDKYTVMAVISTESKFNKDARSHKNAKGLMQLKEETADWCIEQFDIKPSQKDADIYSPGLNIHAGTAYLSYLKNKFNNPDTALAAYNAGEGNVAKWLKGKNPDSLMKIIPFPETKNYVKTVNKRTKIYRFLY